MEYFSVYILRCKDGSYYTGHTDNLEKRISEHRAKKYCNYTEIRLPVEVVFVQHFTTRNEAFVAERKIKKWSRKKKEALIRGSWDDISTLCKKQFN